MKTKTIEVSKVIADELWKLNGQILELKHEVYGLRCCANCGHWNPDRYSVLMNKCNVRDPQKKCNKWQKL